jgi:hypothetical protein
VAALAGVVLCALMVAACSSSGGSTARVSVSSAPPAASTAPDGNAGVAVSPSSPAPVPTCQAAATPGWLAAENRRPGTRATLIWNDSIAVLGYLDRGSAACGDHVGLHLANTGGRSARPVRLAVFRIGAYQGTGARLVWTSPPVDVTTVQSRSVLPQGRAMPHLVLPDWPVSLDLAIDPSWPPGFYVITPVDATGRGVGRPAGPAIPLVIHNDGGHEPILFESSTLTWNAYSDWGGWSLYHGPNGNHALAAANRARSVALHRPITGSGYGQLIYMDVPVVRTIERTATDHSLDVGYTTDVAVDAQPQQLLDHNEVVWGGHSEYWTTAMYDGMVAARKAGVSLVFLGANNLWWHARLEGTAGEEPEQEVVYRELAEDPMAKSDPQQATVLWQSTPLGREPAAILGQSHAGIAVKGGLQLWDAPAWYTAGTGLSPGAVLPGAVGNEADGFNVRGHNPANTQLFGVGLLSGSNGPVIVSNSYSTTESGSAVFAAGSTDWACDPSGGCGDHDVPAATAKAVGILTGNVLVTLASPKAGASHPAHPLVPLTVDQLRPKLAPGAFGGYGGAEPDEGGAQAQGQAAARH